MSGSPVFLVPLCSVILIYYARGSPAVLSLSGAVTPPGRWVCWQAEDRALSGSLLAGVGRRTHWQERWQDGQEWGLTVDLL